MGIEVLLRRYAGRFLLLVPEEPGDWGRDPEGHECLAFCGRQKHSVVPEDVLKGSESVEAEEVPFIISLYERRGISDLHVVDGIPPNSRERRCKALAEAALLKLAEYDKGEAQ